MNVRLHLGVVCALCFGIGGCAESRTPVAPNATVTPLQAKVLPAEDSASAIVPGESTKADVVAALGKTAAIRFDSGFEVWVYRIASDAPPAARAAQRPERQDAAEDEPAKAELVVLFDPSGVVKKKRMRLPPPRAEIAR